MTWYDGIGFGAMNAWMRSWRRWPLLPPGLRRLRLARRMIRPATPNRIVVLINAWLLRRHSEVGP